LADDFSGRLIFDIGFNNGDDTAHDLERGFSVVAVEANPLLVVTYTQFERCLLDVHVVNAIQTCALRGYRAGRASD